jgi:predicted small metal-binding protein
MAYYLTKVSIDTGEINRKGEPVCTKTEFLVTGETVMEIEKKIAEHFRDTMMTYEITGISKSKIEAVVD